MNSARKKFTNIVTIGAPGTVSELLKHYHYMLASVRPWNVRLTALLVNSTNITLLCGKNIAIGTVSALLALTTFLCGRYWRSMPISSASLSVRCRPDQEGRFLSCIYGARCLNPSRCGASCLLKPSHQVLFPLSMDSHPRMWYQQGPNRGLERGVPVRIL